ncbi:GerAB/ArcD/ProY family transporter [Cohnella fermenti]|nr:GerAB/ArcD/ProY family transporter [Cohnella fermenti]
MSQSITKLQGTAIVLMAISPTAMLVVPKNVMNVVEQDAWMSLVLSIAVAAVAAWGLGSFASQAIGGVPYQRWLRGKAGRWVATLGGGLLAAYYYSIASVALHEFISFVSAEVLEYTPKTVLKGVVVLVLMFMAAQGIEATARICVLAMLAMAPLMLLAFVLLLGEMDWHQLLPIADHSWHSVALGGIVPFGWFSESAIILLIAPYMIRQKDAVGSAVNGVLISGSMLLFTVLQSLLVFGPRLVRSMDYAPFELFALIEVGNFFERVEVLFIVFWMATVFLKLGLFFQGAVHLLETTLRMPFRRMPLLAGIGLLLWLDSSTSWPRDMNETLTTSVTTALLFGCNLLLPLLLAALCRLHGRVERSGGDGANE